MGCPSSAGQPDKALSVVDDLLDADLHSTQLLQLGVLLPGRIVNCSPEPLSGRAWASIVDRPEPDDAEENTHGL